MMNLQELRDSFLAEYEFESKRRNQEPQPIPEHLVALWISEAEQDLCDRLKLTKTYQDITVTSGTNSYSLPTDFGIVISVDLGGIRLDYRELERLVNESDDSTTPTRYYSVYYDDFMRVILNPMPTETVTMRVWYYGIPEFYRATGVPAQSWGRFDGDSYIGNLAVPAKYAKTLKMYCMSKALGGSYVEQYEYEVMKHKQILGTTIHEPFSYNFGI